MRPIRPLNPIGQIVGIGIGRIEKTAFFHHQFQRVVGRLALINTKRAGAGNFRVKAHGFADMLAFGLFGNILIFPPAQSVAGDFPVGFFHGGNGFRVARHGKRHAINGDGHVAAGEGAPQAPEAGAGAIFIDGFHIEVALALPGLRADNLGQQTFGRRIAVENAAFAAFLIVDHELHGDVRPSRPARIWRVAPITDEIARIFHCGSSLIFVCFIHDNKDLPLLFPSKNLKDIQR